MPSYVTSCWRPSRPSVSLRCRRLPRWPSSWHQMVRAPSPARRCRSMAVGPRTRGETMRREEVLQLNSMPAAGPSYPAGPYRFVNREYMVITYLTDPEIIREQLPEPLMPLDQPLVHYEWIRM